MTEIKKTKRTNKKFSQEEDARLRKLVNEYGESAWEEMTCLFAPSLSKAIFLKR